MSAMKNEEYIDINKIAELKGLKSNRSLRLAIQKGKYIAREVKVFGGKSYEILYSSLEPEIQEKLQDELIKEATQSNCTALVPLNSTTKYPTFISESAKLTALARVDIVKALQNIRTKYKTKKECLPYNLVYRKYPNFVDCGKNQFKMYNETLELVKKCEQEGRIVVLRPSQSLKIARVEKNLDKLKAIYNLGVSDCTLKLDEIKKYLQQEKSEQVTL